MSYEQTNKQANDKNSSKLEEVDQTCLEYVNTLRHEYINEINNVRATMYAYGYMCTTM